MTLTRLQKIAISYLLISLVPSYLIANWRHEANQLSINEKFERELSLHLSTDKLLINCERNEKKEGTPYDANHQICNEGSQTHELTEKNMHSLELEQERNDSKRFRDFFLLILVFNLLAFVLYKARLLIQREQD